MSKTLIKNATIVNQGRIQEADVLIHKDRIERIDSTIESTFNTNVYDLDGLYLLPGLIDDQVHFREPGLTHKAEINTESRAAVAGGITSYLEMPNTQPHTTTRDRWLDKYAIAKNNSYANFGFMFGGTNDNLEEIKRLDFKKVPALKLFLGSSTGNMLVDDSNVLKEIFLNTPIRIALHCEDEGTINGNLENAIALFGQNIPAHMHPVIRSRQACFLSTQNAINLALETGAKVHIFHLSTEDELVFFDNDLPLKQKQITSEVCLHHLWFSDDDYPTKGFLIKWNPAIKSKKDQDALWKALIEDRIDVLATDHAPHTLEEKQNSYLNCPSGGPLVQHLLPGLLTKCNQGKISIEKIAQKTAHNPAILFDIKDRGFIREGYYADLVVVNPNKSWMVRKEELLYKCNWSPFESETFTGSVISTFVNGNLVYHQGKVNNILSGIPLTFSR